MTWHLILKISCVSSLFKFSMLLGMKYSCTSRHKCSKSFTFTCVCFINCYFSNVLMVFFTITMLFHFSLLIFCIFSNFTFNSNSTKSAITVDIQYFLRLCLFCVWKTLYINDSESCESMLMKCQIRAPRVWKRAKSAYTMLEQLIMLRLGNWYKKCKIFPKQLLSRGHLSSFLKLVRK